MRKIVDLSYHNGDINFEVAGQFLDLAILRVQYGSRKVDSKYHEYVEGCEANGIPHAAYAYGCYVSVADAVIEANDFMNRTSSNAKFLVLDVEDDTLDSCGADDLAKATQVFIDTCRAAGWKVGLYVSHHMYASYGLQDVQADFLWIPRYGRQPAYDCDLWQYTEDGYVEGIDGNVDINQLNSDKSLEWFTDGHVNDGGTLEVVGAEGGLRVRTEPSTDADVNYDAGYKGNGKLYNGSQWLYSEVVTGNDGYQWYCVGSDMWVRGDYVKCVA
ncbi:GH25 family lysozyme [Bacillus toyonensis]|uniref:GH25 family lysozyme n=1 Tax=Bacillus toyonensis TaxID=155322 RepID=UPI003D1A8B83